MGGEGCQFCCPCDEEVKSIFDRDGGGRCLSPPVDFTETSLGGRFSADKSFDCKDLQQFLKMTASYGGGG